MIGAYMDNAEATNAYATAFRRLARMSGFDPKKVLLAESGIMLKAWAGRTKVSTEARADRRTRLHVVRSLGYTQAADRGDVTVNAGFRGGPFGKVWIKVRQGGGRGSFILAKGANFGSPTGSAVFSGTSGRNTLRMSSTTQKWIANVNDAVADIDAIMSNELRKGRQAVGISRQSVVQIADSLGIDLLRVQGGGVSPAGIAKARSAMASNGVAYRNGTSAQGGNAITAYVDLINRLPYATSPKLQMDRTLAGVVAGRAKYIQRSYMAGAFDSQEKVLAAFPNLFVSRAA